jgi:diaminohydroxyphosphoribosylaminopyrimidine deaminase/5-amino-6-(5-phosphoribosylamino)uracil reductase
LNPVLISVKHHPAVIFLVEQGVQRVVIGCLDPNPLVAGRGKAYLEQHGVRVDTYEDPEAFEALNKVFFTNFLKKRPYIALKWARSQDGYVDHVRESTEMPAASISGPIAAINTHRLRAEYDGILISAKTLVLDRPKLNLRHFGGKAPRPIIVGSSSLTIGPKELSAFDISPLIVTQEVIPGFDCIQADPREVVHWLPKLIEHSVYSILVEGGPTLQSSFVRANLMDECHEYVSSESLGQGIPAISIPPNSTTMLGSDQYNKSIG